MALIQNQRCLCLWSWSQPPKDPEGADLSVKALAEMARLSPVDIASVEAGADPKLETLWAVALALDVPFLELVKEARPNG